MLRKSVYPQAVVANRRHLDCRVDAVMVVVVQLPVDGCDQLAEIAEPRGVAQLQFAVVVEGFLKSVLPRAGLGAVRGCDAVLVQQAGVAPADVLAALIGVEDARRCFRPLHRVAEGGNDEGGGVAGGEVPADDLAGVHIHHRCQVEEAVAPRQVGEVARPQHVRPDGAEGLDQIGHGCRKRCQVPFP